MAGCEKVHNLSADTTHRAALPGNRQHDAARARAVTWSILLRYVPSTPEEGSPIAMSLHVGVISLFAKRRNHSLSTYRSVM